MKSGILCAVFALCGSVCFGQWSLEVTGGMPASSAFFDDEYSVEHGYSVGISSRIKIVDEFGLGVHSNFMYLPEIAAVAGDNEAWRIKTKDCEFLFGFDFLLGLSFPLFRTQYVTIPLTVGFRGFGMGIVGDSGKIMNDPGAELEMFQYRYGVGFALTLEYHFSKRFYLLGRVQGGFDFVSYSTSTAKGAGGVITKHDFAFGRSFSVNPQLGIGIQF